MASISCGNIVQDIIDSKIVPIVNLTKVFRYGIGGIATVATDVRLGKELSENVKKVDPKHLKLDKAIPFNIAPIACSLIPNIMFLMVGLSFSLR